MEAGQLASMLAHNLHSCRPKASQGGQCGLSFTPELHAAHLKLGGAAEGYG